MTFCTLATLGFGPALAAETTPRIPLEVGLTVVSAAQDHGLDYEVLRSVVAADDSAVTFVIRRGPVPGADPNPAVITRIIERQDLAESSRLVAYFHPQDPQSFPGSTAVQVSRALFDALSRGEATPFVFGIAAGPLGLLGSRKYYRGELQRVESDAVPMPVLLNGVRTMLPTLHARGLLKVGSDEGIAEFWWLSQPDNPMALRWTFKDAAVQVVRIETPLSESPEAANQLAADLASDACRAELHGIYFPTGSASILPESRSAIEQVAELAGAHPDWQLVLEGHTDSQGSETYNLDLSQRRSEAVLQALTSLGVASGQLTAKGIGEARPVDTNETIEGRARNRRVELTRSCDEQKAN